MTVDPRLQIESRLRAAGLKVTPQRFAVLDYLIHNHTHPTAEQIGVRLNRRFPRVSMATIYNTLGALHTSGLIHEIYVDDRVARYDANLARHHHFICRACGKLEDVPVSAGESPPHCALGSNYQIEDFEIVMRGLCPSCGTRSGSKRKL